MKQEVGGGGNAEQGEEIANGTLCGPMDMFVVLIVIRFHVQTPNYIPQICSVHS